MSVFKVGDRVKFTGPPFTHPGDVILGSFGTVTETVGHRMQKAGEPSVELVTVLFDGDTVQTVLGENRLTAV